MPERKNVQVKVNQDVWENFQKFVIETHGQKYGNLGREVENALKEYVDHDRTARVEEKVDRVLDRLDELDDSHTHKQSETVEKAERIASRLADLGRTVIPDDEVRRAVEDVAGADDRTVRKYRTQLKRRGLAFEHPTGNVWTLDQSQWLQWAENHLDNNPAVEIHDVLEGYPIDYDEYDRAVTVEAVES